MEAISPEAVEQAQRAVERMNRDKDQMCEACTKGHLYRPGEFIPYLEFDASTIAHDKPGFLSITGKCTTCGSLEKYYIDLRPR